MASFPTQPSPDESRVSERKLYRPGETPPAPKTSAFSSASTSTKPPSSPKLKRPSGAASAKPSRVKRYLLMLLLLGFGYYLIYGTPRQRRRLLIGLGVLAWMFLLGSISYCLCLPDLEAISRESRAIFSDQSLTWDQKREKFREIQSNLTPEERQKMREIGQKERERKGNAEIFQFLQMTPEEQAAHLKKQDEERKKFREQMRAAWAASQAKGGGGANGAGGGGRGAAAGAGGANGGGRGGAGGANGGAGGANGGGGGGGRGAGGGGPGAGGPGGPGGGRRDPGLRQKVRLDFSSPESRAGRSFQRGVAQQLGIGGGGRGGFGGGPGGGGPGGGGGGRGGRP